TFLGSMTAGQTRIEPCHDGTRLHRNDLCQLFDGVSQSRPDRGGASATHPRLVGGLSRGVLTFRFATGPSRRGSGRISSRSRALGSSGDNDPAGNQGGGGVASRRTDPGWSVAGEGSK